ncbi:hypothetical protein [Porphyromonas phage phage019b_ATCC49417]|uniref:Uncharacterized protein n=1 Tax=Porphyromonas phage phage019a_ATCC49417 TaxID=3154109 RepID=A0AAT9J8J4_9VIRU
MRQQPPRSFDEGEPRPLERRGFSLAQSDFFPRRQCRRQSHFFPALAGSEGGHFFPSLRRETNGIPRTPYDKKRRLNGI